MITLLITDRERGDDADGVAMGPKYYRVIIDDEGKVRVLELSPCSRTMDWEWTPIEDGCWPELEEELKAEALDFLVKRCSVSSRWFSETGTNEIHCFVERDWSRDCYFSIPIRLGDEDDADGDELDERDRDPGSRCSAASCGNCGRCDS